jgi:HD-like signal output (HDOD) protein
MDRIRKLELLQRSLGIKHKLKVHESMKPPETHEELSALMLARWDLEDELRAIEDLLQAERDGIVAGHRKHYGSAGVVKKKKK